MRTIDATKIEICGLNDLALQTGRFDTVAPAELYFGNQVMPQKLKGWKGMYNVTTGKMASVVTDGYQEIQHNDVCQAVTETLGRLNLDVKGRVNDYHDKVIMDLVFQKDGLAITDDADGIMLGLRVINSYNKTSSFRLEMFGFRKICQNGMTFGARSFGVVESTIHYGSKEKNLAAISRITEAFISKVINSSETMQKYVNEMIGDSLEYSMAKRILAQMVGKKHYEGILAQLAECTTRWQLYNALTAYATHNEQLTPNVKEHMEKLSRKVMETTTSSLRIETMELEQEALVAEV